MCKCGNNPAVNTCYSCSVIPPNIQCGENGVGISTAIINQSGELVITLTNGTTINLGTVIASDGADGVDGLGISDISYNQDNQLVITYTDNTTDTFTLKDKTFFIAATESATQDILGNSLQSTAVIEGDTRFNKDTGSFQIWNGSAWVNHLSIGNKAIIDITDITEFPSTITNNSGNTDQTLFTESINLSLLNGLENGESLEIYFTGKIDNTLISEFASSSYANSNIPSFKLDITDTSGSLINNGIKTNYSVFYNPLYLESTTIKILNADYYFTYKIIITKNSNTVYYLNSELIQSFETSSLHLEEDKAYSMMTKAFTYNQEVTLDSGNVNIIFKYASTNNNISSVTNSIELFDFKIKKIQK